MRQITKSLFESLNENYAGLTIKEYAINLLDGYIDTDVTDTEVAMIVAFTFDFNEEHQYIFESIMYSAMTLYANGGASKSKLAESHRRWEADLERKNEEKLSRTQELNTAKVQALRELGYDEINERNASEVFDKIAEIQSRKIN